MIAEFHLRITAPLLRWVRDTHGEDALAAIADETKLDPTDLTRGTRWVDHPTFEAVLSACRDLTNSDEAFVAACAYQMGEHDAPPRLLRGAIGPHAAYVLGARHMRLIARVCSFRVTRLAGGSLRIQYQSEKPESKLMCLSRQAQMTHMPELWGLPPARLEHPRCIARGDECCEYRLRVYSRPRWLVPMGGLLLAGGLGTALWNWIGIDAFHAILVALLGAGAGQVFELRRALRINQSVALAVNDESISVFAKEVEARSELLELAGRQQRWVDLMEQQVTEHREAMADMATRLEKLGERRVRTLRGFSHDLRNPLTALRSTLPTIETPDTDAVADMIEAIDRMEKMIDELRAV